MGLSDGPSVRLVPGTSCYLLQIHTQGPCTCELNVFVRVQDGGRRVCGVGRGGRRKKSGKSGRCWEELSAVLLMASAVLAGVQVPQELTVTPAQLAYFSGVSQRL